MSRRSAPCLADDLRVEASWAVLSTASCCWRRARPLVHDSGVSWDLDLLPADHGDDPVEWLEAVADEGDAEAARGHADLARIRHPELELGGPFSYGYQLTLPEDSGLPLDVGLYGTHASISVAYWDLGEREAELADVVVDIVDVLTAANGWVAYDPQQGRIVRTDEVRAAFGSGHAHGAEVVKGIGTDEKPKRKRFFGLF